MSKIMYVAHPIGGDVRGNAQRVLDICKRLHSEDVIPFAPYILALQYLDDARPEQRALGTAANMEFIERKVMDELGVFGDRVSKGVFDEIVKAVQVGVPVTAQDPRVEVDVKYAIEAAKRGWEAFRYVVATRVLRNENRFFITKHTGNPADMVVFDSEPVFDVVTRWSDDVVRRDVTVWAGCVKSWDEIYDGWETLEERCAQIEQDKRQVFKDRVYDKLAEIYARKKPLSRVFMNPSFFDSIAARV